MNRTILLHNLALLIGLLLASGIFMLVRYDPTYQFYSVVAGTLYYVLWGIVHHYLLDRVSLKAVLEYILVGGIVVLLFAMLLWLK